MTQGQEVRKHQQINEVWNLWRIFLHKIVERSASIYHKLPGFYQHQYSVFWQKICRKEKCARWSLTTWLLNRNRNRNAWKLQHSWNKYLTLKAKHSCIELWLLTKRGLDPLNRSWNRSQKIGEVQHPRDPKNFDERHKRSSKWWYLLMITEESSWQIEFHVKPVWQQSIVVNGCKNCAEKWTKPDLTCEGMGHSFWKTVHARTWGRLWTIC